ncbi:MAG: xanthine dehydrogenase family protein subunit M [Solirubrobacterales bacterium]|nr:xanthine dehydrogenase family protein subunit M [Solirubrobacterales bacterium]MBV9365130.1 xanthine dehydrogenase family protein subunit M [Solirubrobacterales bacterium]
MKFAPFEYVAPRRLEEAMDVLAESAGDGSVILAGGQSLLPLMATRAVTPRRLIDINGLSDEMAGSTWAEDHLRIGALTRQRAVEQDARIAQRCPLLSEAVAMVGRPAVRTRGTIGGSLAHADPAGEIPVVARALDAEMTIVSRRGVRTVPAAEFFARPQRTTLMDDEILTEVRVPLLPDGSGSAFVEVSRRFGDRCIVGAAAVVTLDQGRVADARIALANVAGTPLRAGRAEALLRGEDASPGLVSEAARIAAEDLTPPSDLHASDEYRQHVVAVLARRALTTAIDRATAPA